MTPAAKTLLVKTIARDVGFDLVGVTGPRLPARAAYYTNWLAEGYAGTMRYLARNVHLRLDPTQLLPGVRSVICVAVNYRRDDGYVRAAPASDSRGRALSGRVAQYVRGRDYHVVLHAMLATLVERLRARIAEPFEVRTFVDTGPVLERELAAAAGLGFVGRNTCLLHPRLGSYLLLGVAFVTLALEPDARLPERCGQCRRCIDACPTGALRAPYRLDARRCIAYLTIEHRGAIAPDLHGPMGDWLLGCDACQQVCPYNAGAPRGRHAELMRELLPARLALPELVALRGGAYRRLVRESAGRRARAAMWRRNAVIVLGGTESSDAVWAALARAGEDEDAGVRLAVAASRVRLGSASGGGTGLSEGAEAGRNFT